MLSITAESVTAARAIFAQHPDPKVRNEDYLAMKLVAPEYWHYSLMKPDYKTGVLVTKTFRFDTNYYVNARTKHMDALLKQAAKDGATQVVNLGVGYDSRAYRFKDTMPDARFFEIDLPAMIVEKKRRLKLALGQVPDDVTYVPIDFNTQNIPDELKKAGYELGRKNVFHLGRGDHVYFRRSRGQHLAVHRQVGTGQFGGLRLHAPGGHPGQLREIS
jgi:methyltransferase (TIGR00027 family)